MDDTTTRHTDAPMTGTGGEDGTLSLARSVRGRYDSLSPQRGGGMVMGMERLQSMAEGGASLSMEIIGRWSSRDAPAVHGPLPFRAGIRRAAIPDGEAPGLRAADSEQSPLSLQGSSIAVGTGSVFGRSAADRGGSATARLQPRLSGSVGQALAGSPGAKAVHERLSRSAMPYAATSSAMAERPSEQTGPATGRPIATGRSAATHQPGAVTGAVPAQVQVRNSGASRPLVQRAEAPMKAEAGEPAPDQVSTAGGQTVSLPLPGQPGTVAALPSFPVARPAGARRQVHLVRLSDTADPKSGNRATERAGEAGASIQPHRMPRGSIFPAGAAPSGAGWDNGATVSRTVSGHDTPMPLSRAQETSTASVSAQGGVPLALSAVPEAAAASAVPNPAATPLVSNPAAVDATATPVTARSFAKGQPYLLRRLPSADNAGSAVTAGSRESASTASGRHAEMRAAPAAVQRKTDGAATLPLSHWATVSPLQRDVVSAAPAEAGHPVQAGPPAQAIAASSRDRAVTPVAGVLPLSAGRERPNRTAGGTELAGNGSGAAALAAAPRTPATLPLARGAMPGAVFRQVSDSPPVGAPAGSSAHLQRTAEQEAASATGPAAAPGAPITAATPAPAPVLPLPGGTMGEPDLERLADRVYAIIEQRLIIEKERRGL